MIEGRIWHDDFESDLVPRPKRKPRRAKCDRGLPPDSELTRLAEEYSSTQIRLWPNLVKADVIAPVSAAVNAQMCEDFKPRHRTGKAIFEIPLQLKKTKLLLGSNYNRYSCDNSEPTSIIDQLHNALVRAHSEDRFIPWNYVFCDYSVSGLNSSRQGYCSFKNILADSSHLIDTIYVDDFTRASRDEMEWWRLAYLAKRLNKRMIGASDGFDLSAPDWDVKITIYGLISRLFIKSLREKVKRGMRGAARRRKCLGRPPLGFTRRVIRDAVGQVIRNAQGLPMYDWAWDETTKQIRQEHSDLFGVKRWTTYQIMKYFDINRYDDWSGWTEKGIKDLLRSPSSIGVFNWNRHSNVRDHESGKTIRVENPRDQWVVVNRPELAIISMELWRIIRRRLAEIECKSSKRPKPSRNQVRATTLFSGTLFCAHCKKELTLLRSAGKYKVFGCLNGTNHAHECKLTTSKSTRVVEECLLGFLSNQLLADDVVEELVRKANAYMAEESRKPMVSDAPIKARIKREESAIKKLLGRLENQESEELCQILEKRIIEHQKLVNQLKAELNNIDRGNRKPPKPLDLNSVLKMLQDVRGLLNQEIPVAAEAIRSITGPIGIHQEVEPGRKRGASWIASFSPDLLGFLHKVAQNKNYPDSITLEFLKAGKWTTPEPVEVRVLFVPKSLKFKKKVETLATNGGSIESIARTIGVSGRVVELALRNPGASVGGGSKSSKHKPSGNPRPTPKYQLVAKEVLELREQQNMPFKKMAKILKISPVLSFAPTTLPSHKLFDSQPKSVNSHGEDPILIWEKATYDAIESGLVAGLPVNEVGGQSWVRRFHGTANQAESKGEKSCVTCEACRRHFPVNIDLSLLRLLSTDPFVTDEFEFCAQGLFRRQNILNRHSLDAKRLPHGRSSGHGSRNESPDHIDLQDVIYTEARNHCVTK